ncbi:3'-5' exonuclease [Hydrogenivirga sp.]
MSFYLRIKKTCLLRRYSRVPGFERFYSEVDLSTRVGSAVFTVFDTETTGLNPNRDELVSIGALKIRSMTLDLSESFHEFVVPAQLSRRSVEIHGITQEELERRAKPVDKVIEEFLLYVRGTVLVGFNVEFDRKMLDKYALAFVGMPLLNYRLDVFSLWKRHGGEGKSLTDIASELGIPVAGAHSALDDAYMTALVFLKLAHRFKDQPLASLPLVI